MHITRPSAYMLFFLLIINSFSLYGKEETTLTNPPPDILDSLIAITIILFILSVIVEKITQLIRKYAPFIRPYSSLKKIFPGLSEYWRNIKRKQTGKFGELDKRIEREVNSLSFVIGLSITLMFRVDLFKMLQEPDPRKVLFWSDDVTYQPFEIIAFGFSIILTAFFLTFGSKFFHDLLDTLFQVKNLKRKLTDDRTFNDIQTIEQFNEFKNAPENKLSLLATEQNHVEIEKTSGVISAGPGYKWDNGKKIGCIEIHVKDATVATKVKTEYDVKFSSGLHIKVPANIIVTGEANTHSSPLGPGARIANKTLALGWGTIGCIVKKKGNSEDRFILSCQHVLNDHLDLSGSGLDSPIHIKIEDKEVEIGKYSFGYRSETMDTALARITSEEVVFDNSHAGNPHIIRKVYPYDAINETQIAIYGGKSGKVSGFIYNDSWNQDFKYPDEVKWLLKDLIVITSYDNNNNYRKITQKGDSGALVVDHKNNAIGIVVGGDSAFTYAIKLDQIEKYFGIELI